MRRADNLTIFMCRLYSNLGASTSWNPQGLSRPVMGLLYRILSLNCSEHIFFPFRMCDCSNANQNFADATFEMRANTSCDDVIFEVNYSCRNVECSPLRYDAVRTCYFFPTTSPTVVYHNTTFSTVSTVGATKRQPHILKHRASNFTQDDTLITSLREPGTTRLCGSSQPYGSHRSRSWPPQFNSGASAFDTDLPQCQVQWLLYCVFAAHCTTTMYSAEKRMHK